MLFFIIIGRSIGTILTTAATTISYIDCIISGVLKDVPSPVHSFSGPALCSTSYSPVFASSTVLEVVVDCFIL
jgi:hypothetical protein